MLKSNQTTNNYNLNARPFPQQMRDFRQRHSPAMLTVMRHRLYLPGRPMCEQAPLVEDVYWQEVFKMRGMKDPGG